ncbi:MAG: sulfatase-like hydrolase/transferase [Phycisphaera sp.]|nr:sulfatase-like hydrolase/transferase [Phycisphaera sp.]
MGVLAKPQAACAAPRPNIIIIMSDDMGYSDIGCFGSEIDTPNLNKLAAEGVRFTQFYNTSRCCPTRASILTGLYPHETGIGHMMEDRGEEGYRGDLNEHCVTIAQVMKSAGYATYMAGKWHVTPKVNPREETDKKNWPLQRGFDRFYGTIHGAGSFYDPNSLTRDNTLISPYADPEYKPDVYYYTDAIADNASRYISEHKKDKPFFMYVTFTAAHWPMHALPQDIAKYKGRYDAGWDALRASRYKRMQEMGLIKPEWKLSPRDPGSPAWEDAPDKEWESSLMEVYAAMVDHLDQGVGKIVSTLKANDQLDNTLVFFLQDNGGCAENMGRGNKITYRDSEPDVLKPMKPEELQYDMIPKRTRDGRVVKQGRGVVPGGPDSYIGYGLSWANASNTPFRMFKHYVHEGGISTPLIAHWPKGIPASRNGAFEPQPGHLIDLMATCVDLAGAKYPESLNGHSIHPMEGVSLAPAFAGKDLNRPNPLFWEHEGNRAVRDGRWKIVAKGRNGKWELHDMEADRSEVNDVASEHSDIVEKMAAEWEAYAERTHVLPYPGGNKKK